MISFDYKIRSVKGNVEERHLGVSDELRITNLKLRQVDKILTRHDFSLIEQEDMSPESILSLVYQNKIGQRIYVHQKWYGPNCSVAERLSVHGIIDAWYTNDVYISTSSRLP